MLGIFNWKYAVGDMVESSTEGTVFTVFLKYSKEGKPYYDVACDGKIFTFTKSMFENSTEKILVKDEEVTTLEWKFKKGDVIKDKECEYTVVGDCVEYGIEMYILRNKFGETIKQRKIVTDQVSELVKPKSLFEQALELVNLKIGDDFEYEFYKSYRARFKVEDDFKLLCLWDTPTTKHLLSVEDLLKNPDKISKIKPKSEAELILDELEKVVDKAKVMLERRIK